MKVAMLLSGRIKCYETCLIPLLQNAPYDVNIFASVNDNESDYYDEARKNLLPWMKELVVEPFAFSERFLEKFINIHGTREPKPYNAMSMFFNQRKAYDMAVQYADNNLFEYDAYLKFRADIHTHGLPQITTTDEYKLFSAVAACDHNDPILVREPLGFTEERYRWICTEIAYGNRKSMKAYTDVYDFCMEMIELFDGLYPCNFETSQLQTVYDRKMPVEFFNHFHHFNPSRHQ